MLNRTYGTFAQKPIFIAIFYEQYSALFQHRSHVVLSRVGSGCPPCHATPYLRKLGYRFLKHPVAVAVVVIYIYIYFFIKSSVVRRRFSCLTYQVRPKKWAYSQYDVYLYEYRLGCLGLYVSLVKSRTPRLPTPSFPPRGSKRLLYFVLGRKAVLDRPWGETLRLPRVARTMSTTPSTPTRQW